MTAVPPRGSNPPFINRDKKIHPEGCILLSGRDDRIRPPASLSLACCLLAAPLRAAADHSLFKDSPNPFIDGCASSRFESSIHKQIKKYTHEGCISLSGRDDRIRTCGLCVPNATLYQTEPHPGGIEYNSTTR